MSAERKNRGYVEHEIVNQLNRKADLRIIGKQIQELTDERAKGDVGNSTKGKIDFLVNFCGYSHFYVKEFKR